MKTTIVACTVVALAAMWASAVIPAAVVVVCALPAIAFRSLDGDR